MKRPTILLADDHTMVSAALRRLLEPDYDVIGCVEDGHALLKMAAERKLDLVLLDVGMPLLNGLDAGRELIKLMPRIKLNLPYHESRPGTGKRSVADRCARLSPEEFSTRGTFGGGPQRAPWHHVCDTSNQARHGAEFYPRP